MTKAKDWFEIDRKGLARLLERRGMAFLVFELLQNSWDEKGVTEVALTMEPVADRRARVKLRIEDDSDEGFRRLSDAWTLFAASYKAGDPTKRGRFNLGEKLVLALSETAKIVSTKGGVLFDNEGRRTLREKRPKGTVVEVVLKMTREQYRKVQDEILRAIPPVGIKTTINGQELFRPESLETVEVKGLPTEFADEEGVLRRTRRNTTVTVFEPGEGEEGWVYEMGIPIVPTGDRWHYDVQQKVPQGMERDNVPPAFLRILRTSVTNAMHESMTADDAASTWGREAAADPNCSQEALERSLDLRFGKKRVQYDPSDPEANHRAVAQGYALVHGRQLSRGERANTRRFSGLLRPAGRLFPSPKPYSDDPNAEPVKVIDPDKYTEGQRRVVGYAKLLGKVLLGFEPTVRIVRTTNNFGAAYGSRTLDFNLFRLGHKWFNGDSPDALERIERLILHEYSHQFSGNHLDHAFADAGHKLGAKLARAIRDGRVVASDFGYRV